MDIMKLADVRAACQAGAARSLRLEAGLSLAEIGDAVGVTAPTVFRWETGERRPHGQAAIRYADLLGELASRQRPRRPLEEFITQGAGNGTPEMREPGSLSGLKGSRGDDAESSA
jgi:transcriptional regulator with XRE-family HTH domain